MINILVHTNKGAMSSCTNHIYLKLTLLPSFPSSFLFPWQKWKNEWKYNRYKGFLLFYFILIKAQVILRRGWLTSLSTKCMWMFSSLIKYTEKIIMNKSTLLWEKCIYDNSKHSKNIWWLIKSCFTKFLKIPLFRSIWLLIGSWFMTSCWGGEGQGCCVSFIYHTIFCLPQHVFLYCIKLIYFYIFI